MRILSNPPAKALLPTPAMARPRIEILELAATTLRREPASKTVIGHSWGDEAGTEHTPQQDPFAFESYGATTERFSAFSQNAIPEPCSVKPSDRKRNDGSQLMQVF